jgi:hypothetical protein
MARKRPETAYQQVEGRFLECRDLRHSWRTSQDFQADTRTIRGRRLKVFTRTLSCTRCGLERTDAFDTNLDRVAMHYAYPDGYQVSRQVEGLRGARAVRVEILGRGGLLA